MKYLLIDDHPLVLEALATQLGADHHCLLASSLQDGLALVDQHRDLDLIILDLGLPDSNGTQGLVQLRVAAPSTPVLVLSANTNAVEIQRVLELGAAGFVPKNSSTAVLKRAIELVLAGEIYLPSQILGFRKNTAPCRNNGDTAAGLTPREKDVVPLLMLGLSNKTIASQLKVSENTVRAHVANILKKMNIENRAQVASRLLLRTP